MSFISTSEPHYQKINCNRTGRMPGFLYSFIMQSISLGKTRLLLALLLAFEYLVENPDADAADQMGKATFYYPHQSVTLAMTPAQFAEAQEAISTSLEEFGPNFYIDADKIHYMVKTDAGPDKTRIQLFANGFTRLLELPNADADALIQRLFTPAPEVAA